LRINILILLFCTPELRPVFGFAQFDGDNVLDGFSHGYVTNLIRAKLVGRGRPKFQK
jgi:hypothetical protein